MYNLDLKLNLLITYFMIDIDVLFTSYLILGTRIITSEIIIMSLDVV